MAKKSAEIVSTQIRMPATLHRKLAKAAEDSRRSLNEEIVWRLEHSLEQDGMSKAIELLNSQEFRNAVLKAVKEGKR